MSKKEKALLRLRQNPKNIRFDDIVTILLGLGFKKQQDSSSHARFTLGKYIIDVPRRKPFVKEVYVKLQKFGIENEDARFVLPNAVESLIVVTANFRDWRHIIELRGGPDAQWEIRNVAIEILKNLKMHAPTVFEDFEIDEQSSTIKKKKL